MVVELKKFQEEYVEILKNNMLKNLEKNQFSINFRSPTGSGKTIMVAEMIKRIVDETYDADQTIQLCFIWIAVNKLHVQSKDKLAEYYNDGTLNCIDWIDINDNIPQNNILFFNWSSINKRAINKIHMEGESQFTLKQIINNTKEQRRKIILIIDESHHTANTPKSLDLIEIINPNIILKMSATPKITNKDLQITVLRELVVEQGMVKQSLKINNVANLDTHTWSDKDVIQIALDKKKELQDKYTQEGVSINPLLLIQIPNKGNEITLEYIKDILLEYGISRENNKLGIYLSDELDKEHLENIHKNDNEIEVLLFKQAIATGWDCPRASILVLFREQFKYEFAVQTIGRIMRMPEFKHYHKSTELNYGYVYTNLENIEIVNELSKLEYAEKFTSNKQFDDDSCLMSEHIMRNNETTRLDGRFHNLFENKVKEIKLLEKFSKNKEKINKYLIVDEIKRFDEESIIKANVDVKIDDDELASLHFTKFVRHMTGKFATKRSSEVISTSISNFFRNQLKISDYDEIVNLTVVNEINRVLFTEIIQKSIENYQKIARDNDITILTNECWDIPKTMEYSSNHEEMNFHKSIMKPTYVKTDGNYQTELNFMKFLDNNDRVQWWFKNGENQEKHFAITYNDQNDKAHKFYVDFIVKTMNGKLWLLETKGGSTLRDISTKYKSNRLFKYVLEQNSNLAGGIVRYDDVQDVWFYYNDPEYNCDSNNHWSSLIFE